MREIAEKRNDAVASDRLYRAVGNVVQEAHGVVSRVAKPIRTAKPNDIKGTKVMIENTINDDKTIAGGNGADFVFYCRAMPNPYWDESLSAKDLCIGKWYNTGMHRRVKS